MAYRRQNKNSYLELAGMAILFIIAPFLTFVLALSKPLKRNNQFFIVLFFAVFGYYRMLAESSDAAYWTHFILRIQEDGINVLITQINKYFNFNIGYLLFLYLFSYINYTAIIWSIIFALTAINFLFIYEMTVRAVTHGRTSFLAAFLFFLLIDYIPFNSFGVKFWLAFILFVTGFSLSVFRDNKKAGNVLIISSFFFHFSLSYLVILYYLFSFFSVKNTQIKLLGILLSLVVVYIVYQYADFGFLEDKYINYQNRSKIEHRSTWIIADRFFTTIVSILTILYSYTIKIKDKQNKNIRNFLLIFAIALLPLFNSLDGLDRYSRAFSFMGLLYVIRLEACKQRLPNFLTSIILLTFSWHVVVNFLLRKREVGFEIFYQPCMEFFTHGPMSIFLYDL